MTHRMLLLAAAALLASVSLVQAQEPPLVQTGAMVSTAAPCPAETCTSCPMAPPEKRSGCVVRIQKMANSRRDQSKNDAGCANGTCDSACPTACDDCPANAQKPSDSKLRRFLGWLCYKPARCCVDDDCKRPLPCCYPPLWTFFPCTGYGGHGACAACPGNGCDSCSTKNKGKTCSTWVADNCCPTCEPCVAECCGKKK